MALATGPALPADQARPELHQALRDATRAVHERLHLHPGFAAVKNGTIGLDAYRALLARLYGFHLPFEDAAAIGADRSTWLRDDLLALGVNAGEVADLPLCNEIPALNSVRQLGALYVVEGSTLGGLALARCLDQLFGSGVVAGRQFFHGRGRATAPAWNTLLARLNRADDNCASRADIIGAAVHIFSVFEDWLSGWRAQHT